MSTARAKVTARTRAREAKAALDASRAARDTKIEAATTDYYVAVDALETAQAALDAADQARASAVATLMDDLTVPADDVARLCGIDAKEVRALRTLARRAEAETLPAETESEPEPE